MLEENTTVLIVDDEQLMREVTAAMIEENNGKVLTAVDGLDAVEVHAENVESIQCVLMDYSMPNMNGFEAYLEMCKVSPELPFVFISGLPITQELSDLCSQGKAMFMSKPYGEKQLMDNISSVLKKR